jgi:predicted dithiol-disulfide oxidoreductase (DUF899 family)
MNPQGDHFHDMRFPGESDEYRRVRDALLRAEKDVRDRTEAMAEQRRQLPLGGVVPADYERMSAIESCILAGRLLPSSRSFWGRGDLIS